MRAQRKRQGIRWPTIRSIWTPPPRKRSAGAWRTGPLCGRFFSVMNLDYLYGYEPNMSEDGACVPFKPECEEMEGKGARAEAEKQTFSKVWNGYYTQRGDRLPGRLLCPA